MAKSFEIRKFVCKPDQDPPEIQAEYDRINRSVILLGDIPIAQLYEMPLYAIQKESKRIADLSNGEQLTWPNLDLHLNLLPKKLASESAETALTIRKFFKENFIVFRNSTCGEKFEDALANLSRVARGLTIRDLFTKPKKYASEAVVSVVRELKDQEIVEFLSNDKCCKSENPVDKCNDKIGKSCYIVVTSGSCSLYSDDCD